ncbi:MAG: hypothetical protein K1X39_04550 [Thermoflexales bacterium]|nr:hypothetical protein [Thermoflexales bacterium]
MRSSLRTSLTALMVLALGLTACREAAPATETPRPVFPTITPTTLPPTLTPAPSATVPPTATAAPTATPPMDLARLYPTPTPRAGTPTPTPKTVNGAPQVWWADQMVKQPDGTYMAPQAVIDQIAGDITYPIVLISSDKPGYEISDNTNFQANHYDEVWGPYLTKKQLDKLHESPPDRVFVVFSRTVTLSDARSFSSDGTSAFATLHYSVGTGTTYTIPKMSLEPPVVLALEHRKALFAAVVEIWQVAFDVKDGRWKLDRFVKLSRE